MRFGYRAAVTLMRLLLLPRVDERWVDMVKRFIKSGQATVRQRAHLSALVRQVQRRITKKKTIVYPAGMSTDKGTPASRGKRVVSMPFGTWYYKPKD